MIARNAKRLRARVTIDSRAYELDLLVWADGATMSSVRNGGVDYFRRAPGRGPNAWTLGGRLVAIEVL